MPNKLPRALVMTVGLASLAVSAPARASEIRFSSTDVVTVFYISKSDDRNRVDYGMRLDAECVPVGDAVFPYWREFEKSPPVVTHGISLPEHIPYGITEQGLVKRTTTGAEYFMRLRQFDRTIGITTKKEADGTCSAMPRAKINNVVAHLLSVFAKIAGPISVDYIDVHGKDFATGAVLDERIKK